MHICEIWTIWLTQFEVTPLWCLNPSIILVCEHTIIQTLLSGNNLEPRIHSPTEHSLESQDTQSPDSVHHSQLFSQSRQQGYYSHAYSSQPNCASTCINHQRSDHISPALLYPGSLC